jgi:universal stress protein A
MFKYKHILVATDFSEGSRFVLNRALELAKPMGAKVSLLHIVEPLPGYGYAFLGTAEIEVELLEKSKEHLKAFGREFSISESDQHVEIGPTKVEIVRMADELGADLIVVGSHGRHGLMNLLGSTANAVIHEANCDVLTVRMQALHDRE